MTVEIGHENVKHFIFGKVIWTAVNHSASKVFKQQLVKWKLLNCNNQNDVDDFLRVIELIYLFHLITILNHQQLTQIPGNDLEGHFLLPMHL